MVVPWVMDEIKTADLRDKRLNDRSTEVLSLLGGIHQRTFPRPAVDTRRRPSPIVCSIMTTRLSRLFFGHISIRRENAWRRVQWSGTHATKLKPKDVFQKAITNRPKRPPRCRLRWHRSPKA